MEIALTTIRDVAARAGVSTATVSAVVNDSAYVSPELKARVRQAIEETGYAPSQLARNLKRGSSQIIAAIVADLSNPFYGRLIACAEAAVATWGYSLVVYNSDEKPDNEQRNLERAKRLSCDGLILVPVAAASAYGRIARDLPPTVLFGRSVNGDWLDTVAIDNFEAAQRVTDYLLDMGHRKIGSITGPVQYSTGRDRLAGMVETMKKRGVEPDPRFIRTGEFREEVAYSAARELLRKPDRPSALYVANGVMALGVMRAITDLGLRCPEDISVASTDTIPGVAGLKPRLTRTEHPVNEMANEALRLLVDRIRNGNAEPQRNVVYQPAMVLGDSVRPIGN